MKGVEPKVLGITHLHSRASLALTFALLLRAAAPPRGEKGGAAGVLGLGMSPWHKSHGSLLARRDLVLLFFLNP